MARAKPRPFVDTNVFFSGFYRAGSPPATILELHAEGEIEIVVSLQVLEELATTIRAKKPDLLPKLQTFLTNAPPEVCPDPTHDEVRRAATWINPTDAPILAAAIKARADCLVTGNTRHFTREVAMAAKITILTPTEYRATLERRRAKRPSARP